MWLGSFVSVCISFLSFSLLIFFYFAYFHFSSTWDMSVPKVITGWETSSERWCPPPCQASVLPWSTSAQPLASWVPSGQLSKHMHLILRLSCANGTSYRWLFCICFLTQPILETSSSLYRTVPHWLWQSHTHRHQGRWQHWPFRQVFSG